MNRPPKRTPIPHHYGLCTNKNSPYWFVVYRDERNRRLKKSTKIRINEPNSHTRARQIGQGIVDGVAVIQRGISVPERSRELYDEALRAHGLATITAPPFAQWCAKWLAAQKGAVAESTLKRYRNCCDALTKYLRSINRLQAPISDLESADINGFRDWLAAEHAPNTTNFAVRIARMIFAAAEAEGLVSRNVARTVRVLKVVKTEKGIFTPEEVALLVSTAEPEWQTLILLAYFSSQRLTDCARLEWEAIDLEHRVIRFRARKTGTVVDCPIHSQLFEHLQRLEPRTGPACPELSRKAANLLSAKFARLMRRCGLDGNRTFHSLRHGAISSMLNAGIDASTRRKISGHSDVVMHESYSDPDWRNKVAAIESIGALPR
jgi:integrase